MANILIVLTSHTQLGDTGKATGFYFEELATPYFALTDAGHTVHIASIKGGPGAHDPGSLKADEAARPASVQRFVNDPSATAKLAATTAISDINPADYHGVFLPGGHGTMYDFPLSDALAKAVGSIYDAGGVVGAVCHGPAGLVNAMRADGKPLVAGLKFSAFTDAEEEAVGLVSSIPPGNAPDRTGRPVSGRSQLYGEGGARWPAGHGAEPDVEQGHRRVAA
jgi:putative intracellular protease/amidase